MQIAIFANGPIADYRFIGGIISKSANIIACDGGCKHTQELGILPHCIIGDFDSAPKGLVEEYEDMGIKKITFPSQKDDTDLALCMAYALSLSPSSIVVFGASGGRFDHMLANVHVLTQPLHHGVPTAMHDESSTIRLLDKECALYSDKFDVVSLIPFTEAVHGVSTEGLLYPLSSETLTQGSTRGVSNIIVGKKAIVTIKSGILIVVQVKGQ